MVELNIGCGPKSRWIADTEGIDLIDFGQNYVGDFTTYKFDHKFDNIYAHHVFEHLTDPVSFINAVCKNLKKGGILDIRVPILPYDQAFVDPTHKLFVVFPETFLYFTKHSPAGHCYSEKEFEIMHTDRDRFEWEGHIMMKLL